MKLDPRFVGRRLKSQPRLFSKQNVEGQSSKVTYSPRRVISNDFSVFSVLGVSPAARGSDGGEGRARMSDNFGIGQPPPMAVLLLKEFSEGRRIDYLDHW